MTAAQTQPLYAGDCEHNLGLQSPNEPGVCVQLVTHVHDFDLHRVS